MTKLKEWLDKAVSAVLGVATAIWTILLVITAFLAPIALLIVIIGTIMGAIGG